MRFKAILIVAILSFVSCQSAMTAEEARKELGRMNVQFNEASFIESAANGDMVAVDLFLTAGMGPDVRHPQGQLAYTLANSYTPAGFPDQTKTNFEFRDKFDGQTNLGMTALMAASIKGRLEVVRKLLKAGVDINAQDRFGYTAWSYAYWQQHQEVRDLLSNAGGNGKPIS